MIRYTMRVPSCRTGTPQRGRCYPFNFLQMHNPNKFVKGMCDKKFQDPSRFAYFYLSEYVACCCSQITS